MVVFKKLKLNTIHYKMSSDEEDCRIKCLTCKKEICEKPWLIVKLDEECSVYGCSYLCANQFRELIGIGYWSKVINKEDFSEPRPVYGYSNRISNGDITTGFGMDEIKDEVQKENERIEIIEDDYYYDTEYSSDEDNYEY